MLRTKFNGCDIVVMRGDCTPVEEKTKTADGSTATRLLTNPQAGTWAWSVSKAGRDRIFSGHDWSQTAALRAAQEQASDAPAERSRAYTPVV